jgi:hypothetical protein
VAFTEAEKVSIYRYTGWADRFHQTDDVLARAIPAIEARASAEAAVRVLLLRCDGIETSIIAAQSRLKALGVGPIALSGPGEIDMLRDIGRQWSAQVAQLFGVPMRRDPWSSALPTESASWTGPTGGNGELPFG